MEANSYYRKNEYFARERIAMVAERLVIREKWLNKNLKW